MTKPACAGFALTGLAGDLGQCAQSLVQASFVARRGIAMDHATPGHAIDIGSRGTVCFLRLVFVLRLDGFKHGLDARTHERALGGVACAVLVGLASTLLSLGSIGHEKLLKPAETRRANMLISAGFVNPVGAGIMRRFALPAAAHGHP